MSYHSLLSDEQVTKFNKYVAKNTKKVMIDKVIEVNTYRRKFKVKITGIIPPDNRWGNFRVNVKVIESLCEVAVRGEDGFLLRDDIGNIKYQYVPRTLTRSEVNSCNHRIRDGVKYACGDMVEFFGVSRWDIKVEKVKHL